MVGFRTFVKLNTYKANVIAGTKVYEQKSVQQQYGPSSRRH